MCRRNEREPNKVAFRLEANQLLLQQQSKKLQTYTLLETQRLHSSEVWTSVASKDAEAAVASLRRQAFEQGVELSHIDLKTSDSLDPSISAGGNYLHLGTAVAMVSSSLCALLGAPVRCEAMNKEGVVALSSIRNAAYRLGSHRALAMEHDILRVGLHFLHLAAR